MAIPILRSQVVNAVDELLCTLEDSSAEPFGGKMVLMGGDWKQLLPVVKEAYSMEILDYTLKKSRNWARFEVSGCSDYGQ